MTEIFEGDRALILKWIDEVPNLSDRWPGLPLSHIPLVMTPTLRAMIEDDTVHLVEVIKARKDPIGAAQGKTITYTYVQKSLI